MILDQPEHFRVLTKEDYKKLGEGNPETNRIKITRCYQEHTVLVYDPPIKGKPRIYTRRFQNQRLEEILQERGIDECLLSKEEQANMRYALNNGGGTMDIHNADFSTAILEESINLLGSYSYHPDFDKPEFEKKVQEMPHELREIQFTTFPCIPENQDELEKPPKRKILKKSQESDLFLRYNFARYKLGKIMLPFFQGSDYNVQDINKYSGIVEETKSVLANANLPLVLAMAKRVRIPEATFSEIISEGNFALLRAIDKFDVSRGFKFSTYACRAILKAYQRFSENLGKYHQRFSVGFSSETEPSNHRDEFHREELEYTKEILKKVIKSNSAGLSDIEMKIINERFPLSEVKQGTTLTKTGTIVDLTSERVRQLQVTALKKLRIAMGTEMRYLPPKLRTSASFASSVRACR